MNRSTGPTYTRYKCQISESCELFDSALGLADCYERGGRLARNCSESSRKVPESSSISSKFDR